MKKNNILKQTWNFIWKEDSAWSWIVSVILAFLIVKFVFFPLMSLIFGTTLPLVVVESSSMYHDGSFIRDFTGIINTKQDSIEYWWDKNKFWYVPKNISLEDAKKWSFKSGMDKGDIVIVRGIKAEKLKIGDIIIFNANQKHPIIHRIVGLKANNNTITFETKGDNNPGQLPLEKNIQQDQVIGKALIRLPKIGWIKLFVVDIINLFR